MARKKVDYNIAHPTTAYALEIMNENVLCCKPEKQLAQKYLKDLTRQGTENFPYVFDESRANRFFDFYRMCLNPDTNEFYEPMPHSMFDDGLLYGWVHKDTGIRRFTTVYEQGSRGTTKTTRCAIKAMYGLVADKVYPPGKPELGYTIPNAIIQLMAVDKGQAEELREPIVNISKSSPRLKSLIDAKTTYIKGKKHGGQIKVLSKELANKQGGKPNLVIIDEYSSHPTAKRAEAAKKGLGKKAQGLVYIITTAGDNEETNPAKSEYDYAKKVLSGEIIDENYLPIIRETEKKDNIYDPKIWSKSNPMFRYCGKYAYSDTLFATVEKEQKRAFEGNAPELQREFKIYRLNMWQERAVDSYLSAEDINLYNECEVSVEEFKMLVNGKQCINGFDFSLRRDLTADGCVWQLSDGRIAIDATGFMPLETLKSHEQTDRIPYAEYIKQEVLFTTLGTMTNKEEFAHVVCKKVKKYNSTIKEICYDPYKARECALDFMDGKYDFLGAGMFNEENVIEIPQNNRTLHIPTTFLRDKIREKKIVHNGNPLLKWCLMNCFVFESKAGELIRVGKENKDSPRRIDLAAAVINALARIDTLKDDAWSDRMASKTEGFF